MRLGGLQFLEQQLHLGELAGLPAGGAELVSLEARDLQLEFLDEGLHQHHLGIAPADDLLELGDAVKELLLRGLCHAQNFASTARPVPREIHCQPNRASSRCSDGPLRHPGALGTAPVDAFEQHGQLG